MRSISLLVVVHVNLYIYPISFTWATFCFLYFSIDFPFFLGGGVENVEWRLGVRDTLGGVIIHVGIVVGDVI